MTNSIKAPLLNPNDPVATVAHWYVESGAHVKIGDALCDLTTSKASFTVEAEHAGFIGALRPKQTKVRAGETIAMLFDSTNEAKAAKPAVTSSSQGQPVFSRKALSRLRAAGLNEDDFLGLEFVTEKDVERKLSGGGTGDMFKEAEVSLLTPAYREALRSSVTVRVVLANKHTKDFEQMFFAQAFWAHQVSQALVKHPRFLRLRQEDLHGREPEVDIGYAVNSGEGARQFLAKRADAWDVNAWREHLTRWSLASARGQIRPDELGCGRFSITDLSALGVWQFEPLLVGDQSAILAIGGDPKENAREFTLTLAFDHRAHDGRQAAEFLNFIREQAKA